MSLWGFCSNSSTRARDTILIWGQRQRHWSEDRDRDTDQFLGSCTWTYLVWDVITVLQQQVSQTLCPQQEVDQLIQQRWGLDESDNSTEDGGGDQNHLLIPEETNRPGLRPLCANEPSEAVSEGVGVVTCAAAEAGPRPPTTGDGCTETPSPPTPEDTDTCEAVMEDLPPTRRNWDTWSSDCKATVYGRLENIFKDTADITVVVSYIPDTAPSTCGASLIRWSRKSNQEKKLVMWSKARGSDLRSELVGNREKNIAVLLLSSYNISTHSGTTCTALCWVTPDVFVLLSLYSVRTCTSMEYETSSALVRDPNSPEGAGSTAPAASQPAGLPAGPDHSEPPLKSQTEARRAAGGCQRPSYTRSLSVETVIETLHTSPPW